MIMLANLAQYDSALTLFNLLENLGISTAEKAHSDFIVNNADDWTVCDYCDELNSDCRCDRAPNYSLGCTCGEGKCYC